MPATDWGWLITPDELQSWILADNADVLLINKPGGVVCHPSKHGPWSSLIGACREYLGVAQLHMPSRLDRETSGVVIFAKEKSVASLLQKAIQERQVLKTYYAVLTGTLRDEVIVDAPLGRDERSAFYCRQWVRPDGQPASTRFVPLASVGLYTFARVHPQSGRLHQIRVHASYIGHAVAGDKLYGPDERLMFEFLDHGFTGRLPELLPLPRHALHAARLEFQDIATYEAPLTGDLIAFCQENGLITPAATADCSSLR